MKRNPLIPFAVIAAFGIVFMLVIGIWGGHAAQDREAKSNGTTEQKTTASAATPDQIFQKNCAICHGNNLQGGVGPNLQKIGASKTKDDILNQIKNGGGQMPGGIISGDDAQKVADWLSQKK